MHPQVNVFVLGSVFLQLAQLLRLHDLPIFQRCAAVPTLQSPRTPCLLAQTPFWQQHLQLYRLTKCTRASYTAPCACTPRKSHPVLWRQHLHRRTLLNQLQHTTYRPVHPSLCIHCIVGRLEPPSALSPAFN